MLAFLRHGQTDANLYKRSAGGEWDVGLNATGREQARLFSDQNFNLLRTITHLYISPMRRAQQTAEIVFGDMIKDIRTETIEDLREWRLGQWSGLFHHETPNYFEERSTPPGGEPYEEFESRCLKSMKTLAARQNQTAMIVAHGGVWYTYAQHLKPENLWLQNCVKEEVCRIRIQDLNF